MRAPRSASADASPATVYRAALIAPLAAVWLVAYVMPLLLLFVASFLRIERVSVHFDAVTLDNYAAFLADPFYLSVMLRTLLLALVTTCLTLILGVPYAVLCSMVPSTMRTALLVLVISPALMSAVVRSYGWIVLLGNNGVLNYGLVGLGLADRPVRLLFTFAGVVIGLSQVLLPFMVLPIISVLQKSDRSLTEAAANLGATRMQTVLRVTLPLSVPGVLAGGSLVFVAAYAHFAVPQLLGGGSFLVNSTLVYQQITALENYGGAAALSIIMMITSLAIVFLGNVLVGRLSPGEGRADG